MAKQVCTGIDPSPDFSKILFEDDESEWGDDLSMVGDQDLEEAEMDVENEDPDQPYTQHQWHRPCSRWSPTQGSPSALESAENVEQDDEEYMIPDAHSIFDTMNEFDMEGGTETNNKRTSDGGKRVCVKMSRIRPSGMNDTRGHGQVPSRRSRGGRRGAIGKRARCWRLGDPIQVIWTHDDDVPAELREMVAEVVRSREMKARESKNAKRARGRLANEVCERESDEVFYDAEDRGGDLLAGGNTNFEWSSDMTKFQKEEVPFTYNRTGAVGSFPTAYDAFRSYWDDKILNTIVEKTNFFATKIDSTIFQQKWVPTNADEILCLFAFWMMLGIIRMPTIKSCFSDEALLKVHIFKKIFSSTRYKNLVRALHFVEADPAMDSLASTSISGPERADRMYSLRPILDHLNTKFQANYIPSKDICIDESLTPWKGCLNIKQYVRSKAGKFGIKTYELCEAATGYLWSFVVHTGGHANPDLPDEPSLLKSTAVVRRLMTPLLNKGYRLFMDSWCSSPLLARWLKRNGTDCVGILNYPRSDVPPIINVAKLNRGQLIARHSGDVCVAAWQDSKKIVTISTCHGTEAGLSKVLSKNISRPMPFKPQVVLECNRFIGGVEMKDQLLEPYMIERKRCHKWFMKLFKRLLNCSILNARILLASSSQKPQNHLVFRLSLVNAILTNHLHQCPTKRKDTIHTKADPTRITANTHWPVHIAQTSADAARNRQSRKNCFICLKMGKKIQRTRFECEMCKVPLCIETCFKFYHTTPNI